MARDHSLWNVVLPRGDWVQDYPTTNAKIIVGLALCVGYFYFLGLLVVVGVLMDIRAHGFDLREWQLAVLQGMGVFALSLAAVGVVQFAIKQNTIKAGMQSPATSVDSTDPSVSKEPVTVKKDAAPAKKAATPAEEGD